MRLSELLGSYLDMLEGRRGPSIMDDEKQAVLRRAIEIVLDPLVSEEAVAEAVGRAKREVAGG